MRQFWKSFKQLCKDLWGFYDVIYYTAFKRNCNEITFQEGTYALESRQKRKLRSLLIGNFIIMGIAIYLGGRLTEMLFANQFFLSGVLAIFVVVIGADLIYLILAKRYLFAYLIDKNTKITV